jgi:DNA-binding transcriptional ArsR family regulator
MKNLDIDSAVAVARALGHPARLRTVAMLRSGELCPCQITEVLGLASSTVSAHLKELKQAGLIVERKDGRWVFVELAESDVTRSWIETSLAPLTDDPQLAEDARKIEELRGLSVEDLCRFGYETAKARAGEITG